MRAAWVVVACLLLASCASVLYEDYRDVPMVECAWCSRTSGLQRHHVIPQSVDAGKRQDTNNIVVLCWRCHLVLGHRNNYRSYNPDVRMILEVFTNVLPCGQSDLSQ